MKWFILLIIITVFMIPIVSGTEECQRVVEPEDIPCKAISTWVYPNSCDTYDVQIFNQSGVLLEELNMTSYGSTGLCIFNFTHEIKGTYVYNVSSGDTGAIVVEVKNLLIALVLGIAVICAILLWFTHILSDEHVFLKILIVSGCVTLLSIIPSAFVINDASIILHKAYMRLLTVFALYIFVYLIWKLLIKLGAVVPGENNNNG